MSTATGVGLSPLLAWKSQAPLGSSGYPFGLAEPSKIVSLLFSLRETNVSSPVLGNDPAIPSQIAAGQLRKHHADAEQILYSPALATKHELGQGYASASSENTSGTRQTKQHNSSQSPTCSFFITFFLQERLILAAATPQILDTHVACPASLYPHPTSSCLSLHINSCTLSNILLKCTALIYFKKKSV